MIGKAVDKVLTTGTNAIVDSIVGMLTIFLLKSIVGALPLIAIIGAGFLVIVFSSHVPAWFQALPTLLLF